MEKRDGFQGSLMTILPPSIINEWANDSFTKDLFLTHIGYFPHAEHHFRQRDIGLDEYVLLCCTEGKGWIKYSDKHINLDAGKAFIIPAGVSHSYGADKADPWTIYWLHFKGEKSETYYRELTGIISFRINSKPISAVLLFREMLFEAGESLSGKRLSSALCHLLLKLVQEKELPEERLVNNLTVEKCKKYLSRNLDRGIMLEDIVRVSGVSATQCGILFKKYCGMTPMAYLTHLRIEEARRMLELTDLKIKEICSMVGIDDPYYFSRLFAGHVGQSPQQYRKNLTED